MDSNSVAFAAIGLAGSICAGFFAMVNRQNKIHSKIAEGLDSLAKATKQGNKEAKERNGHLAELVIQTADTTQGLLNKPVNVQTVETQVVKEQK
jgi:hypothetical protein